MFCVAVAFLAAIFLVNGHSAQAQASASPQATLKFEVASIKPSQPGANTGGIRPAAGGERYVQNLPGGTVQTSVAPRD